MRFGIWLLNGSNATQKDHKQMQFLTFLFPYCCLVFEKHSTHLGQLLEACEVVAVVFKISSHNGDLPGTQQKSSVLESVRLPVAAGFSCSHRSHSMFLCDLPVYSNPASPLLTAAFVEALKHHSFFQYLPLQYRKDF